MRVTFFPFRIALISVVVVGMTSPASAQVLDDFNRANSATLGPGWTQQAGTSGILDNRAIGSSGGLATYNSGFGDVVSFDIFSTGNSLQYGAAVIGFGGGDNFFVKVQAQDAGGLFDHYAFYTGNNSNPGSAFFTLTGTFESAHVTVTRSGTWATLEIMPNIGSLQTYTYDYGFAPSGTGIGLGFYGPVQLDNFGADTVVPEPSTYSLLAFGLTGLASAARRRRSIRSA